MFWLRATVNWDTVMTSDNEYSDSTDTTTTLEGFVFILILLPSLTAKKQYPMERAIH